MTKTIKECPLCGDKRIYESFFSIECPNPNCENYSIAQRELVEELEKSIEETEPVDEDDFSTIPYLGFAHRTTIPCAPPAPKGGVTLPDDSSTIPCPPRTRSDSDIGWLIPPIT